MTSEACEKNMAHSGGEHQVLSDDDPYVKRHKSYKVQRSCDVSEISVITWQKIRWVNSVHCSWHLQCSSKLSTFI
jgi:hypothetical protein